LIGVINHSAGCGSAAAGACVLLLRNIRVCSH
jgi:hypothetical protein